jgi:hypothetical protein
MSGAARSCRDASSNMGPCGPVPSLLHRHRPATPWRAGRRAGRSLHRPAPGCTGGPPRPSAPSRRRPACRHDRTVLDHPGLRHHRLPARRHPRPAATTLPHRPHRVGGIDLEQATNPGRAGGGPGACGRTRRLHRRRPCRQGAGHNRPDRLHHSPGRLRPAQAPRQGQARQARSVTALQVLPQAARTSSGCSPSATRSSAPSWPLSAGPRLGRNPPTGPPSTATTRPCASACRPSSPTSASPPTAAPQHRQPFVDPDSSSC